MTPPGMLVAGRRVVAKASPGYGPNGRRLCRWCHQEVPAGRRRTWCSDRCVQEYRSIAAPREAVFERDRGVCASCGFDTERLRRVLRHAARALANAHGIGCVYEINQWVEEFMGLNAQRTLWEADHVVPVIEGGTVALENLRTLCVDCHKRETAKLRRRLAAR